MLARVMGFTVEQPSVRVSSYGIESRVATGSRKLKVELEIEQQGAIDEGLYKIFAQSGMVKLSVIDEQEPEKIEEVIEVAKDTLDHW